MPVLACAAAGVRHASNAATSNPADKELSKADSGLRLIRNVGIMAHIDAGKTTVTERMLFYADVTRTVGEVHEGDTVMDFMDQERERGITINAASISFGWLDHQINLIDTPGHVDFTIEVERSLRVLDGAVAVFDGVAGVEAQSETVWRQANTYGVPRIVFINKLDREGAEVGITLKGLEERLGAVPLLAQLPIGTSGGFRGVLDLISMEALIFDASDKGRDVVRIPLLPPDSAADLAANQISGAMVQAAADARERLVERASDYDDALANSFLTHGGGGVDAVPPEALTAALRRVTLKQGTDAVVVMIGSAFKNKAVQPLMDAVVKLLPSPLDRPPVQANVVAPASKQRAAGKADAAIVLRRSCRLS